MGQGFLCALCGYVLKGVSAGELRNIVRNVANGDAYVTPTLAAEMLTEFSRPPAPTFCPGANNGSRLLRRLRGD